ncbi:MAG: mechanosensitive ion channel [Rikenellaceae bacterium]|jgi:small conductance mechanosensitive channel|nr:mechanosensitive ion channel [Rikenellaceae bacterium]
MVQAENVIAKTAEAVKPENVISMLKELSQQSLHEIAGDLTRSIMITVGNMLLALLFYYLGRLAIKIIRRTLERVMKRRQVDMSLQRFVLSCTQVALTALLLVCIVSIIGVKTTGLTAIFAATSLGIGMAMSGTLQNFASGVMILLTKTYRIGDYIEAQGQAGTVKEIRLFHTCINTVDNKTIVIPNGLISNGIVNNYSAEPDRRLEWTFDISYGDDFDLARQAVTDILEADGRVVQKRDKLVAISSLASSSVTVVARAWVPAAEYWNVYFDVLEKIYKTLPARGLNFPFPQLDVHLQK